MEKKKILVVEDEFVTAAALRLCLEGMGCAVVGTADTGERAVKAAAEYKPDLILMDIILKGEMSGITAADIIRHQYDIPIIYFTGQSDEATINRALESEPFGYIVKPFEEKNLKSSIMMALYKHSIDLKLKASEERYRTIAELSDDGIFIIANDYSVAYANGSAVRILNRKPTEIIDKSLNDLVPEEMFRQIRTVIDEVHATNKSKQIRQEYRFGGCQLWFDTAAIPLTTADDSIWQVMMIIHDITDQVMLEEKMAREGITQLEKNMEQFQYLNDQIRNPLQVITGLTMLEKGPYQEKILEQAAMIDNLVSKLDMGWYNSEKVRNFLLRHYRHDGKIDNEAETLGVPGQNREVMIP